MNRLEKYEKEHLENVAFDKAELYQELLEVGMKQEDRNECEDLLKTYMGYDEFKKLSKVNFDMIIGAMQEYAENFKNR
jgi:hypothetical protein